MHKLADVLLLLPVVVGAAAISVAPAMHVDSFSYPAFDATTTQDLVVVARNSTSVRTPASHLFDPDGGAFAELNGTEGFLLLSRAASPAFEASFNTSFVTGGASTVAFVVLFLEDGSSSFAGGGLNVTVIPDGTAVWIEYDAAAHRLIEYVSGAGEAKLAMAIHNLSLVLGGQRTTEKAMVGFFGSRIHDILVGVRDWNLTVDRFDDSSKAGDGRKKDTSCSWWMILLAVLGSSVAATA